MCRKLSVSFCIFITTLVTLELQAQKLVVRLNQGNENISNLADVQKLYFSDNELVIDYYSGPDGTYGISDVRKVYFDTEISVDENISPSDNGLIVFPNPATDFITITGIPDVDGELSIYSIDGRRVFVKPVSLSHESIDLGGLPQGLYLVNVPGLTTKFVKK